MFSRSTNRLFSLPNFGYLSTRNKRVWARKPIGSPMAKSKVFKIPVKPAIPADETIEIKRLYDNYKTSMKSLRQYFYEQALKQADTGESAQLKMKLEDEEHLRLMEENRLENKRTAAQREERLKIEAEKTKQKVLNTLIQKEKENELLQAEFATFIAKQKVSPIIHKDQIGKAIEEALANPVDFNFAIDLDGYVYRGKEVSIDQIPDESRERLPCN